MAEFCLDCWNELNETNDPPEQYIISKYFTLCEGCGEYKHVILAEHEYFYSDAFKYFLLPLEGFCLLIYVLWQILILPYLIYKYYKSK